MSDDASSDRDEPDPNRDDGPADDGDRDPSDSFDEYRDRDGDPFGSLGDAPTDEDTPPGGPDGSHSPAERAATPSDGREGEGGESDPFEYGTGRDRDGTDRASDPAQADAGDPLADAEVPDEDPFESNPNAFERSDVEGIDPDEVWTRLTGESGGESDPDSDSGAATATERTGTDGQFPGDEGDVAEVSKHAYCEGCEHFSPPPDVTCAHEGTEILEFVDVDTVRVADCPVVAERRELEDDG